MTKLDFTDDAVDSAITGGSTAEKVLYGDFYLENVKVT
jgi:hypothetical protein